MSEEIPGACQKCSKGSYLDYHRLGIDLSVMSLRVAERYRIAELDQKTEDFRIAENLAEAETEAF